MQTRRERLGRLDAQRHFIVVNITCSLLATCQIQILRSCRAQVQRRHTGKVRSPNTSEGRSRCRYTPCLPVKLVLLIRHARAWPAPARQPVEKHWVAGGANRLQRQSCFHLRPRKVSTKEIAVVCFLRFFHSMCLLANVQPCAGPDTFALLVGNTKQMWEHFLMACACHQVCLFVQQGSCSIAPSTDICGKMSESHLCNDFRGFQSRAEPGAVLPVTAPASSYCHWNHDGSVTTRCCCWFCRSSWT